MSYSQPVLNVIGAIGENLKSPSASVHSDVEELCKKLRMYEMIIKVTKDCDMDVYVDTCNQMLGYICAMFSTFVLFEAELTPVAQLLQQQMVELKVELNDKKYEVYQRTINGCNNLIECAKDLFRQLFKKKHPLEEEHEYANLWYDILYAQINIVDCSKVSKQKIKEILVNLKEYVKRLNHLPFTEIRVLVKTVKKCYKEDYILHECDAIIDDISDERIEQDCRIPEY